MPNKSSMKAAMVQFDPTWGDPQANMAKADRLIKSLQGVNLIILPEMAFSGYVFKTKDEIRPFLEPDNGPSVAWAINWGF